MSDSTIIAMTISIRETIIVFLSSSVSKMEKGKEYDASLAVEFRMLTKVCCKLK